MEMGSLSMRNKGLRTCCRNLCVWGLGLACKSRRGQYAVLSLLVRDVHARFPDRCIDHMLLKCVLQQMKFTNLNNFNPVHSSLSSPSRSSSSLSLHISPLTLISPLSILSFPFFSSLSNLKFQKSFKSQISSLKYHLKIFISRISLLRGV